MLQGEKAEGKADRPAGRGFSVDGARFAADSLEPGLYVVATPIGHLEDITLRALKTLAGVDRIVCEDTRITRRLTGRYGITTPLTAYHDHNAERVRPRLLAELAAGASIALVSDAGTPLVSDPGYRLVEAAIKADIPVVACPGPSALLASLVVAGLPSDAFCFLGFLPPKSAQRRRKLAVYAELPASLVVYEARSRIAATLADMIAVFGPDCRAVLARELTKAFETVRRGTLAELADQVAAKPPRGEIVVLVGPRAAGPGLSDAEIDGMIRQGLAAATPVKAIAAEIAERSGQSRRAIYARVLALRDGQAG